MAISQLDRICKFTISIFNISAKSGISAIEGEAETRNDL